MVLKSNMSLIPNNLAYVAESPIWNTLILSHPKLMYNIEDFDDEEEEEEEDLLVVAIESEEANYTC